MENKMYLVLDSATRELVDTREYSSLFLACRASLEYTRLTGRSSEVLSVVASPVEKTVVYSK
jgi:hypothetical protein